MPSAYYTGKMRDVCKNCGEFFAFHGAKPPHDCPVTPSSNGTTTFLPLGYTPKRRDAP